MEPGEKFIPFRNFIPESDKRAHSPKRLPLRSDTLFAVLNKESKRLSRFRRLPLMDESKFVSWARDRGVEASGIVHNTDVDLLWRLGWLRADYCAVARRRRRYQANEEPQEFVDEREIGHIAPKVGRWNRYQYELHPFRIFPLHMILQKMKWNLVRTNVLSYSPGVHQGAKSHIYWFRWWKRNHSKEHLNYWNGIADLAILLEPLYWPDIAGETHEHSNEFSRYRKRVLRLLARIPKGTVAFAHMELRHQAAMLDSNAELYLLARTSSWRTREQYKGLFAGALWLRHMAEVIRLGFDELYEDRLVHEDEAFGYWVPDARDFMYGSKYPLDDLPKLARRIRRHMHVPGEISVRVYVEGDTERGAFEEVLRPFLGESIEIVNLRAQFGRKTSYGWDAQRLRDDLKRDRDSECISFIIVDGDSREMITALKRMVSDDLVVGMIMLNNPDFEFHNFQLKELIRATRILEEMQGYKFGPLPISKFRGVLSGREFASRYEELRHSPGLKSAQWGAALSRLAFEEATDESRPLVHVLRSCMRSTTVNYSAQVNKGKVVWSDEKRGFINVVDPSHPFMKSKP